MDRIKKNFGFGFMRLPMIDGQIDKDQVCRMVDAFIDHGFNYFDTAHGYLSGNSELALKDCLTSRYPREAYVLTNKLSGNYFQCQDDIRPLFEKQLERCGVTYFDFYLMHAQEKTLFEKYKRCKAYETAMELRNEGKIRHLGISFHDTAETLEQILTEYPCIEVVQIQLNYLDYEDPSVQSKKCLEVCRKFGKPAIIMEPVKGGSLINLPEDAQRIFDELHGGSNASYAIRFAASQEGVFMVLSGMGNMDMVLDNTGYMQDFQPLSPVEAEAVEKVCGIIKNQDAIACTACRYCTEVCPQGIDIPVLFACMNDYKKYKKWNSSYYYNSIHTANGGKASSCIVCGQCEKICPQHLEIRKLLKTVADAFEK